MDRLPGGDYTVNEHVGVSLYTSQFKDVWNQYYAGTTLSYPLSESVALIGGFNYYRAVDEGKTPGSFDNNIWSGKTGVKFGAHTVTVGYQRNNGNDDFDLRQSDSIFWITLFSTATSTPRKSNPCSFATI
jgi:hypothetical protein